MAEITLRLSAAESKALLREQPFGVRRSNIRRSAEFKLRQAIWRAYPELREGADKLPRCGAQDWVYDDDGEPIIYGTCELPRGHLGRFHRETRDGTIWAEWGGPSYARAPTKARGTDGEQHG